MDSSKYIFSSDRRSVAQKELSTRNFDLLIIGGGITGAGIALDAASRGLSVALIEKADFASGTSSRSTKLVHGGLRYLKQMEFKLVRNVGIERAIVYKNAPHLVVPEKMLLPIIEGGTFGKTATRFGLWLYDRLAKVSKDDRRVMLSLKNTKESEPLLQKKGLKGSGLYSEYRTDDSRLTLEVMKTASQNGAMVLNYATCKNFNYEHDQIKGATIFNEESGETFKINAKNIVNACGPWVDDVRKLDGEISGKYLMLTKGIHLVVDRSKFNIAQSVYFDVKGGRMIFAIPRFDRTYIGTTDTFYSDEKEEPGVTQEDAKYLIDAVNKMFPKVELSDKDIISTWSGLRPLIHEEGKSPSEVSRKDEIFTSEKGLISIAGGKLTGYRLMAKKVVDLVCSNLNLNQECRTESIIISGGDFRSPDYVNQYIHSVKTRLNCTNYDAQILVRTFGKQTDEILTIAKNFDDNLILAQAKFCLKNEYCLKLTDFFVRRTGMLFFYPEKLKSNIENVSRLFATNNSWNEEKRKAEISEVLQLLEDALSFK